MMGGPSPGIRRSAVMSVIFGSLEAALVIAWLGVNPIPIPHIEWDIWGGTGVDEEGVCVDEIACGRKGRGECDTILPEVMDRYLLV